MKEFLSHYAVPYVIKNVVHDPAALAEFNRRGFLLPPVVVVDGEVVQGYDPERLASLLDEP